MSSKEKKSIQFPNDDDGSNCPAIEGEEQATTCGRIIIFISLECQEMNQYCKVSASYENARSVPRRVELKSHSSEDGDSWDDEDCTDKGTGSLGENSDAWKKEDGASISCVCIICSHTTTGYEAADTMKLHVEEVHHLSFAKLKSLFALDYCGFVKFVRWARELKELGTVGERIQELCSTAETSPPSYTSCTGQSTTDTKWPWTDERFLLPPSGGGETNEESDYFLTLDYFTFDDSDVKQLSSETIEIEELVAQIKRLDDDKRRMTDVINRILADNNKMGNTGSRRGNRVDAGEIVRAGYILTEPYGSSPEPSSSAAPGSSGGMGDRAPRTMTSDSGRSTAASSTSSTAVKSSSGCFSAKKNNEAYFESYDEVGIHHEMIFDHPRTDAYLRAIRDRALDIKNMVVMDVGCGTGILSMFCAKEGAEKVFAVDKSEIILTALENAYENQLTQKIRFVNQDLDSSTIDELKGKKVDVLVSEFMGYFLFFEGMTETYIRARDKYLKPDGLMLPSKCSVHMVPLGPTGIYKSKMMCWDDVYGLKMSSMKTKMTKEALIETVTPEEIIGKPVQLKSLDLTTCSVDDVFIDEDYNFEFTQDSELCAVAGYFDVEFPGRTDNIVLSTSPWNKPTHWKQAVLFLPEQIPVKCGDVLKGSFIAHCHPNNERGLLIELQAGKVKMIYEFR